MRPISYFVCVAWLLLLSVRPVVAGMSEQRQPKGAIEARRDTVTPEPAITRQVACRQKLDTIAPSAPELARLRHLFKKNLHLRGTAHNLLPHWNANYDDFLIVRRSLSESDIPFIIFLLTNGELSSGIPSIAIGELIIFGASSLPCIEAGLQGNPAYGVQELQGAKASIEAAAQKY